MFGRWLSRVGLFAAAALGGCTSMFYAHDPQTGPMSRDQIPGFLQSMRCELITFYAANAQRRRLYLYYANRDRNYALSNFSYFELADSLFGGISLDLKVVDTLGLPGANTNFNRVFPQDATHSTSWHVGPAFSDTNTYEMVRNFLIGQDQRLSGPTISTLQYEAGDIPAADPFQCYKAIPQTPEQKALGKINRKDVEDFDGLARGDYPKLAQFQRMIVNLTMPLAAWLQENANDTWSNFRARSPTLEDNENIIPAQTTYSFTVQVQLGLDLTYSLVSTRWNPFAVDGSASSQQTSFLQFVLNGPDAALTAGAKTGSALVRNRTIPAGLVAPLSRGTLIYPLPLPLPSPPPSR
jgi:hypothetical protein